MRLGFTDDAAGRAACTAKIRDLLGQLDHEPRLRAPVATEYDLGIGYREMVGNLRPAVAAVTIEEPPMRAFIETLPPVVNPAADIVPDANRAAFTGLPAVSVRDFGLPS